MSAYDPLSWSARHWLASMVAPPSAKAHLGVENPANSPFNSGNPWNSSDMVSFTKATALGEFEIMSDDVQKLTLRKPKTFREVCEQRLASLKE